MMGQECYICSGLLVATSPVAGIGYDKLANTFLEYENTKVHKTLKYDNLPSANIIFYLLPVNPTSSQSVNFTTSCRSILPLVGQSCLTLFLALAMVGTRATCIRVAKVKRLP